MPAREKEAEISQEGAEKHRGEGWQRAEDALMGEEASQHGDAFALGDAAEENGDQSVLLDQMMQHLGHAVRSGFCIPTTSRDRLATSSRRRAISRWRNSSSFSCRAMISISAFRFTS